ncbi:MAG: phytanoyl-CoA dioxygenase family protein [Actinomycetota bacterium]|nr:phytanoyl-CoA dioxygenase family protein [Actinomycetota bacterium]
MDIPDPTTDLDRALHDLSVAGVAVLAGALPDERVAEAREHLDAVAEAERRAGTAILEDGSSSDGQYRSGANQRVVALLAKGEVFRRLAVDRAVVEIIRRAFGGTYGYPDEVVETYGLDRVLVSSVTANIARRGGREMGLHADQGFVPATTPYPVIVNAVWPLVDFTADNGATRVAPGSHLQDQVALTTQPPATIAVEAPAGSVVLVDGRTWHGTGANRTSRPRPAILATYCRPWVRTFANHALELDPQVLVDAPDELLDLVGYRPWLTFGHAEHRHLEALSTAGR